jgi:hypothetical protein
MRNTSAWVALGIIIFITAISAQADTIAANTFKKAVNQRILGCRVSEAGKYQPAPPFLELSEGTSAGTTAPVILAAAHYANGDYSVDDDFIAKDFLVIDLVDTFDGPMAQNELKIPLSELSKLESAPESVIVGIDHYSEAMNGTSDDLKLKCKLE